MADALLRLMAWLSPAFPVGSFSYSHGLERAVQDGQVAGSDGLGAWIEALVTHGSAWNDAVLFAESWRRAGAGGDVGDIGVPADSAAMDFAAWIEVFLGGRWWTFDPRNNQRRIGRVVVARGHDAADVPLMNSFGQHVLESFRVWCHPVDGSGRELDGMLFA